MNDNSFSTSIEVANRPQEVFNALSQVSKWWTTDFEGAAANAGDEFVICHPGAHFSKHKLVEVVPGKRVVWLVTESELPWLKDPGEWTNTRMVFEIEAIGDDTRLKFTHKGLLPKLECYSRVVQGWQMVINEQLFNFISTGKTI